jgi:hypothetical protein
VAPRAAERTRLHGPPPHRPLAPAHSTSGRVGAMLGRGVPGSLVGDTSRRPRTQP